MFKPLRIVAIFILSYVFTSCHVGRYFIYNFANINDYQKFPNREIASSHTPFEFIEKPDTTRWLKGAFKEEFGNLAQFEQLLKENQTVGFMLISNDTIIYQWFGNDYTEDDMMTSFSMSKSFISALVGVALSEGYIKSLDDPITDYIQLFKHDGFEKITIRHLLEMQTGIDYKESYVNPFGNVAVAYYGRNLDRHISKLKIKGNPGEKFEYVSIATQLLGNVLEGATGQTVSVYMHEKIWKEIGATQSASWSLDRKTGREKSFCCINALAKDFAKVGRLYMNYGKWNGKTVIPESWIRQSVEVTDGNYAKPYQYQWWLFGKADKSVPNAMLYAAQGHLGQIMAINPVKKLMVVRFGKNWGKVRWMKLISMLNHQFE
jgi:CubicO group peptidase (beta-lactamase class C family)